MVPGGSERLRRIAQTLEGASSVELTLDGELTPSQMDDILRVVIVVDGVGVADWFVWMSREVTSPAKNKEQGLSVAVCRQYSRTSVCLSSVRTMETRPAPLPASWLMLTSSSASMFANELLPQASRIRFSRKLADVLRTRRLLTMKGTKRVDETVKCYEFAQLWRATIASWTLI